MGISLGEIVIDGDQPHGDGINIAVRVEGLAELGGICISDIGYHQVKHRLPFQYHDLGEQHLKHIPEAVRVWRIVLDGAEGPQSEVQSAKGKVERQKLRKVSLRVFVSVVVVLVAGLIAVRYFPFSTPSTQPPTPALTRQTLYCRPALYQHQWRPGAGVFQRRPSGRPHHRTHQTLRAVCHRPQFHVHLQRQSGEGARRKPRAGGTVCIRRQCPQGRQQRDQAIAEGERALVLAPNCADCYAGMAWILILAGRPAEAIGLVEKAMRLNPRCPQSYLFTLGFAYRLTGQYEEAIEASQQTLACSPNFLWAHLHLAATYSEMGREEEARAEVAEILRISPHFSPEVFIQKTPQKDPAITERTLAALRKAGLK
jgi:tetratricopeptide (TPR) repeat protein